METIIKQFAPYLIQIALDNRHILIDWLVIEAEKTDNVLDDYVVKIVTEYINSL